MSENEQTMRLIPICQIRPDPAQPRQLLPPDLATMLSSGASPFEILDQLRARADRDKWTRERLTELDALAHSIGEDGLMQPIRVIPDGDDRYKIEEGERRWWAHHILVQQGKERSQTIVAFVVEKEGESSGVLRRRVAENVLRSDLTAIELARAMATRIQEILAAEPGTKRGDAERRVGKENGMSDRRVRQFVALLTLSPEVQELAQEARLSENSLRPIVGIKDAARQLAMVRELIHPSREKIGNRSGGHDSGNNEGALSPRIAAAHALVR
jgi:ParB family chromosome partitioning protein